MVNFAYQIDGVTACRKHGFGIVNPGVMGITTLLAVHDLEICLNCVSARHLICLKIRVLLLFLSFVELHNSAHRTWRYSSARKARKKLPRSRQPSADDFMTRTSAATLRPSPHLSRRPQRLTLLFCAAAIVLMLGIPAAHAQEQAKIQDTIAQRALACAACHGKEGRATRDGYFPRIAGKPAGYLYNQLINFREGRRQYPLMTYMVAHLSDDYLKEMAQYFSALHLPYPSPQPLPQGQTATPQVLERGRALVMNGDSARKLPACVSCHGEQLTGVSPSIPSLVGLSRDYLNSQFGAWKNGARRAAAPDCMAEISRQLTPEDIGAVSTWLASRPVPNDMTPGRENSVKLPVPCGSFPQ
jgi:cytochrome c553